MKVKYLFVAAMSMVATLSLAKERYVGGDISLLPEYEIAGAQYKDHDGKPISDLLPYLYDEGMNAMRVRLFVNPKDYNGSDKDPNACQDLEYILPLCKRIVDDGFSLMLDFHYSDTWADPAKQWTPEIWKDLTDEQLYEAVYDYTRETLQSLKNNGVIPKFIQTGNEISFGMLWGTQGTPDSNLKKTFMGSDANWERLGKLLQETGNACREICPDAKIVIHTERVGDIPVQKNFYEKMKSLNVDYDIIGISYYPYFHGSLTQLNNALESLETNFPDKDIMVVETGFSYAWEVPGTDQKVDYDYSDAGQNQFAKDLVATLLKHENVTGLFWWWLEYNAYGTSLSGWYNAPLFDSRTGGATSALKTICKFGSGHNGVEQLPFIEGKDSDIWYNLNGMRVNGLNKPGIYMGRDKKIIVR
ncbi:MAG: arabinogalactan endo-1,4-beta-galactosidase [Bacteroides sp.]|nr:arabinogalactan endo-1,4-beta-galactosidase [Bacteroides sp.]